MKMLAPIYLLGQYIKRIISKIKTFFTIRRDQRVTSFDRDWKKWTKATGKSYMQWLSCRQLKNKMAAKEKGHFVLDETIVRLRQHILQEPD